MALQSVGWVIIVMKWSGILIGRGNDLGKAQGSMSLDLSVLRG